jgi:glycosyltransferase involved in cell wall biosynthesis
MRIALVSQEYPPETAKGGIGTQTHAKAHGLAALGHEIVVVSRAPDGLPSEQLDNDVRVVRVPGLERRMPLHTEVADWLTYSGAVAEAVARLHHQQPFDLVEFPEWAAEGYVHLINRTRWYGLPTVVHLHGPLVLFGHAMGWPDVDSDFFRIGTQLERTCVERADALMSSSRCSLDWVARHYGRSTEGVPILHTGVDTRFFRPADTPKEDRPTIVFAGKLAANKGIYVLLEAALEVVREIPDLRLRLLGRGQPHEIDALRRRAAECGREKMLDLAGFVPHAEIPREFSRAHVFAAPSLYESGPGLVNLEAMACGLPVVTTSGSGADEAVEHGLSGLVVHPSDPADLASALRRLLTDRELCRRLGENARHAMEVQFDTRICVQRIETFYRSVVDAHLGRSTTSV